MATGARLGCVRESIARYYTDKVTEFGATPLGADWTCVATQEMRFVQLLKLCDWSAPFTLNDLGCGYGALVGFLEQRRSACAVDYLGIDLSAAMLRHARRQWRGRGHVRFFEGHCSPRIADYSIASGIFNVRQELPSASWVAFISATLDHLALTSLRGFAVNFVAAPPLGTVVPSGLYATVPERWAGYCARHLGMEAEVIDGYGLREFTLLVRRRRHA